MKHVAQYDHTSLCFVLNIVSLDAMTQNTDARVASLVVPVQWYLRGNSFHGKSGGTYALAVTVRQNLDEETS